MPIREGQIVTGPLFGEAMRVETVRPNAAPISSASPTPYLPCYPVGSDEKRLLDAMLLAVPR